MAESTVVAIKAPEDGASPESSKKEDKKEKTVRASTAEFYQFTCCMERTMLLIAALAATGCGVAMPMMMFAFGDAFDGLGVSLTVSSASSSSSMMNQVLFTFVWIGLGMFGGRFLYCSCTDYVCHSQVFQYKRAYLKGVLRQDVGWYDTSNPEELASKFAEAMVKVKKGMAASAFLVFEGFGYGMGGLVMSFYFQWDVALVTLATVPLLIISASVMMYVMENGSKTVAKAYSKAGGIATEALFSMRTVAALGIEETVEDNYKKSLAGAHRVSVVNASVLGMSLGCALSAYLVMMAAAVIYGGYRLAGELDASSFDYVVPSPVGVRYAYCADGMNHMASITTGTCESPLQALRMTCQLAGTISTSADTPYSTSMAGVPNGTLIQAFGFNDTSSFAASLRQDGPSAYLAENADYFGCSINARVIILAIFAVMMAGEGFSMAGQPAQVISQAREAAGEVFAIVKRIPAVDSFSDEGAKPSEVRGEIRVTDVVFAYPTAPTHLVCNGYNLSIPAGKTVALCGPSGSGKSTIIQLIERFYDPQEGVVTLDGVDIKTLNVRWLRSQLSLVGQEPVLFQGSIAMNIGYGKPTKATQQEIEEAAKMAHAHDFISGRLADGYNTDVGQGGGKLSGGQKQRVAIARAIIKNPAVLLLDEATSALDNASERIVQAALDSVAAKQKRTTIVIAHRLSTIRHADKIAVLHEGKVVEEGKYDELMAHEDGPFFKLAKRQEELQARDQEARWAYPRESTTSETPIETSNDVVAGKPAKKRSFLMTLNSKEEEKEKKESAPIGRLLKMQADRAVHLVLMFLFSVVACIGPSIAFYLMVLIMEILYYPSADHIREDSVYWAGVLGALAGGTIFGFLCSGYFNGEAGAALTRKLRASGMASLMRQDIGYFDIDGNSASEMSAFLAEKVAMVKTITTEQLDLVAQLIGGVGSAVVIIFWKCAWQLALAWMALLPVMGIIMSIQSAVMIGDPDEKRKAKGQDLSKMALAQGTADKIVGEAVMGIRTVASFNLEQLFYDGYCDTSSKIMWQGKRDAIVGAFFNGLSMAVIVGLVGLVFWYGMWLANNGVIDFAAAMGPMFVITGAMVPMMKATALSALGSATAAAVKLFGLFDRVPSINAFADDGGKLDQVRGEIEVKDVVFAYPTAPDYAVCKGYSLLIPAGKTVALCGASGSGKSTIIQLIERFYDPQGGVLTLDGVDIKALNVRWLRSQLGLVGQEPVLFQGSVTMNIRYGKPDATQQEIEEAAKMANAHGFITGNLADGYNTDVGLKGGRLSGGQKQRVAIARAIVKRPAVLLLDEATSALDNESERVVQAALDSVVAARKPTTIVIAHRLTTIRDADKIAVLQEGKVVEEGTHDELLKQGGLYASLVLSH